MKIRDYQYINSIDTGKTYEVELIKYFKIDTNQPLEKVREALENKLKFDKDYQLEDKITFNGKTWFYEKDVLDATFEQWVRLETILAEEDNIKNFHKLLAIYFRPATKTRVFKRKVIEPFNINTQDSIANELLDLPLEKANALLLFFWLAVPKYMTNIKIQFLNLINQEITTIINTK